MNCTGRLNTKLRSANTAGTLSGASLPLRSIYGGGGVRCPAVPHHYTPSETYYVVVGGGSEQTAKRDDGRETGEVHEEERRDTLHVKTVLVVAHVPLRLQLHVLDQTSEQPTTQRRPTEDTRRSAYLRHASVTSARCRYRRAAGTSASTSGTVP